MKKRIFERAQRLATRHQGGDLYAFFSKTDLGTALPLHQGDLEPASLRIPFLSPDQSGHQENSHQQRSGW